MWVVAASPNASSCFITGEGASTQGRCSRSLTEHALPTGTTVSMTTSQRRPYSARACLARGFIAGIVWQYSSTNSSMSEMLFGLDGMKGTASRMHSDDESGSSPSPRASANERRALSVRVLHLSTSAP